MDRPITYYGALARALDVLQMGQKAMVGLAKLTESILGTSTCVSGFTCTPTAPASMSVNVNPGVVYELENLEGSAVSLLSPDTHNIMKQGMLLDATTKTLAAPTTVGYSVNVLIETQYEDADIGNTLLSYYNSAEPSEPFNGPGNNGQQQPTIRAGVAAIQTKYGVPATSGTQVTPAPDAGWVGLFVVTLSFGQTSITAGNIVQYFNAPFIQTLTNVAASVPQKLSSNIQLYVNASTGDDGNPGTQTQAFRTLQAVRNYAQNNFNLNGTYSVTYICTGAFTAGVTANGLIPGQNGPGGEVFSFTSGSSVAVTNATCLTAANGAQFTIQTASGQVTLSATGTAVGYGNALAATYGGSQIQVGTGINFGSCYGSHVIANGGTINLNNAYTISGGAQSHWAIILNGGYVATNILTPQTITITGTPNFAAAFAYTSTPGQIAGPGLTFSGSATGPRYFATNNGTISTNGAGANYLPGNSAGSVSAGGQYS